MKKITYVTGNWAKIASAKQALEPLGYEIDNIKMETPEIQADDVTDVSKYSAKWAAEKLGVPVLKNDSGLFVNSLKGFPGVYTHYADDTIGEEGLLKLMEGIEDRTAYFKESIAYCEPGKEPVVFEGLTKGRIDTKKSGLLRLKNKTLLPAFQVANSAKIKKCLSDKDQTQSTSGNHGLQMKPKR